MDDTPAGRIARLDASLLAHGETVTLRRRVGTGATFVEVTLKARLRGYQPDELVGGINQTMSAFVFSPTEIAAAITANTWPGAAAGGNLPKIGDFIRSSGGSDRKIEAIQPARVGDAIVRYDGRVLG